MSFVKSAFASAALLAGVLFASAPDTADAQIRFSIGSGGSGQNGYQNRSYGYSNSGNRAYNRGHRSSGYRNGGYNGRGNTVWHDTSHYDYHPTTVVPHGNHYHVQPGHYDLHRSGHYDTYRGGHSGHQH